MKRIFSQNEYQDFLKNPFNFHSMILNADLGEGNSSDEAIMRWVHAANIACGGHAGDAGTIRTTVKNAIRNQLIIGAHPSYKDPDNFGRISLFESHDSDIIISDVVEQVELAEEICQQEKTMLRYIKPHGALYHDLNRHAELTQSMVTAIKKYFPNAALIGFADSLLMRIADSQGIETWPESFADRQYDSDGSLVKRNHKTISAVLSKEDSIAQARSLSNGWVNDIKNNRITIRSKTLCLHSDTPDATEIASAVFSTIFSSTKQ